MDKNNYAYPWVCKSIKMTGATSGAGTAYPSVVP